MDFGRTRGGTDVQVSLRWSAIRRALRYGASTLRRRVSDSFSPSTLRCRNCKTGTSTRPCNSGAVSLHCDVRARRLAWCKRGQITYRSTFRPRPVMPPLRISDVARSLNWRTVDMRADQECPTFDPLFPTRRLVARRVPHAPARVDISPARWPAASPSAADSGPSATIGPTPGMTTATAAARCAASSPNRDAVDESSISEPGDAPPASARAPSSSCVRATIDTRSRGMPSVRRSRRRRGGR